MVFDESNGSPMDHAMHVILKNSHFRPTCMYVVSYSIQKLYACILVKTYVASSKYTVIVGKW